MMKYHYCILLCLLVQVCFGQIPKSLTEPTQSSTSETPTTYAIVVGVSKYQHIRPELKYAHKDAIDFKNYLISEAGGRVNPANITLLTDSTATWPQIDAAFGILREKIGTTKGCKIVLFFSMHGGTNNRNSLNLGHLFTYDTEYSRLGSTSMPITYLRQEIQTLVSDQQATVQVYIDACRSGLMMKNEQDENLVAVQLLSEWDNVIKIISCQPRESSYEGPQWENGVFTHYLLKGLRGMADWNGDRSGQTTAEELQSYLKKVKQDLTADNPQSPQRSGDENTILSNVHQPTLELVKANRDLLPNMQPLESKGLVESILSKASTQTQKAYADFKKKLSEPAPSDEVNNAYKALAANPELKRIKGIMKFEIIAKHLDESNKFFFEYLGNSLTSPDINANTLIRIIKNLSFVQEELGEKHPNYNKTQAALCNYLGIVFFEFEKDSTKALRIFDKAIEYDSSSFFSYFRKTVIFSKMGRFDDAIREINQGLSLVPNSAIFHFIKAFTYIDFEKYEEAIPSLNNVLRLKKDSGEALWVKGICLRVIGRHSEALECFEEALKTDYDKPMLFHTIGRQMFHLERYDESLAYYAKAFKLDSTRSDSYLRIGQIYLKKGKPKEALNYYHASLKYDSTDTNTYMAIALLYIQQENFEEALKPLEHSLQYDSTNVSIIGAAAIASRQLKRYNKTINYWQSYLKYKPNDKTAISTIALCYMSLEQYDKAKEYYLKSETIAVLDSDESYNLACIFSLENQAAKSLEYLEKALNTGFKDFEHMQQDPDLENIRPLPAFKTLLEKYQK